MRTNTFSVPYTPSLPWISVNPRPLLPIQCHPHSPQSPSLPSPARKDTIHDAYVLSTHIIPAAFPRSVPDVPLPEIPTLSSLTSASLRRKQVTTIIKELIERQTRFAQGKLTGDFSQKPLWNCINRCVRKHSRNTVRTGLTLLLVHGNGYPKEIWETMLRSLLDSTAGPLIDEVWSWEAVHHGDSALVNAKNLSGIFDWQDDARDIVNFLVNYLPEEATPVPLPTCLARLPGATSNARKDLGYRHRRLITVGHSFGGTSSALAALNFPKLFSSVILVDPIIPADKPRGIDEILRRNFWSSREEALRQFIQSPFFASWHPEVLKTYVDHGLTVDATGIARLKMTPVQEGLSIVNAPVSFEVWELLEKLDENITLRWVVPSPGFLGDEETEARVWRRPANASNVVFPFAGHLIVQEAPIELAHDIATFLLTKYGSPRTKASL
ncbi:Alpha/beta hydrolase family-domain-containing protein [Pisolithus marmoratus]|nr:Alpha/beta hydrolase family-domain-containing protein [Pisolithus marmoratus]